VALQWTFLARTGVLAVLAPRTRNTFCVTWSALIRHRLSTEGYWPLVCVNDCFSRWIRKKKISSRSLGRVWSELYHYFRVVSLIYHTLKETTETCSK